MTVGIGAVYQGEEPAVVLVADRMVTTGAVEYEHAESKIVTLSAGKPAVAAIASGTLSYHDEVFYRADQRMITPPRPDTVQEVAEALREGLHDVIKDAANNQILNDYELTLRQLTNDGIGLPDHLVEQLIQRVSQLKQEIQEGTNILIGGVDEKDGPQLLELGGGDIIRHDSLGYQAIGSGGSLARLTFIRTEYDPESVEDAFSIAADAKNQAEEAQGVGREMDIAVVGNRVNELEEREVNRVQDLLDDIRTREQDAREKAISEADLSELTGL